MTVPPDTQKEKTSSKEEKSTAGRGKASHTNRSTEVYDDLVSYAKANTKDTVAFVLIIIGAVMMFFDLFWGGLIVGAVAGIYFGEEIVAFIRRFNEIYEEQGNARSFIAAGVLFAVLIAVPSLYLGAAITIAIRHLAIDKKA